MLRGDEDGLGGREQDREQDKEAGVLGRLR